MLRQTVAYGSHGCAAFYAVGDTALRVVLGDEGLDPESLHRAARPALDRIGSILCVASGVVDMSTGMLLSYETVDNHPPEVLDLRRGLPQVGQRRHAPRPGPQGGARAQPVNDRQGPLPTGGAPAAAGVPATRCAGPPGASGAAAEAC